MDSNVSQLLEKINVLLKGGPVANLSKLERDLALQYLRQLYELLSEEPKATVQHHMHGHKEDAETLQPEELIIGTSKPEEENILLNDVDEPRSEPRIEAEQVEEPEIPTSKPVAETVKPIKTSLNEKAVKGSESLNEKVKITSAEIHKKFSSKHLKDMVDLNKRFIFVNELFKGNAAEFNQAIHQIDTATDYATAESYIKNELATIYEWDATAQSSRLFIKLVKQKFGVE